MSEVVVVIKGKPFLGVEKGNQDSLLKTAIKVSNQAKILAPTDKGQLRNSVMYRTEKIDGGFNNSGGKKAPNELQVKAKKGEAYVGSNLDYATYQEYGTRKMNAQPFLRPAVDIVKLDDVVPIMRKEMEKALRKGTKIITYSNVKAGV